MHCRTGAATLQAPQEYASHGAADHPAAKSVKPKVRKDSINRPGRVLTSSMHLSTSCITLELRTQQQQFAFELFTILTGQADA